MPPCITSCNMGAAQAAQPHVVGLNQVSPKCCIFLGRNQTHMLWLAGQWKAAKPESKKAFAFQAKTEICICTRAKTGFAFCILIQFAICTLAFSGRAGPAVRQFGVRPKPPSNPKTTMKSS